MNEQNDRPPLPASAGHRKRLLDRYRRNGLESLQPHEIIELVLTFTIPRCDTKKMAHDLYGRYKSIGMLLNAPRQDIVRTAGIGERSASLITLVGEIMSYCLKEKFERQSIIKHRRDVEEYLRYTFGHYQDEYVAVLYLGNRNQIIESPIIARGTVNQCIVHPRVILEKALRYGATSLIVVHNHPGGSHAPSEADWTFTGRCHTLCSLMELPMLDHLIVCRGGVVSLKELPRWPGIPVT
ncbi:MAG: DNA repair protein RadC [Chitinispirillaceae bacterium]|nr:DNA repair protein RadC [Chitinispirillaceae bacterium]